MKKILIFIVGIFGIGFSFCSSQSYNFNISDYNVLYDSSLSEVSVGVFGGGLVGYETASDYTTSGTIGILSFTGFSDSLLVNDFCFSQFGTVNSINSFNYYINGESRSYFLTGGKLCFNLSEPIEITKDNDSIEFFFLRSSNNISSFPKILYGSNDFFHQKVANFYKYYFSLGDGIYFNLKFPYYNGAMGNSSFPYIYSFSVVVPQNPKFKVNYGDTSYEYDLSDNLEIRLNSPVFKDGDNYSYNGSTGINLFYNGGSQFYNKSELFLFTPSWYSANIFTPICL